MGIPDGFSSPIAHRLGVETAHLLPDAPGTPGVVSSARYYGVPRSFSIIPSAGSHHALPPIREQVVVRGWMSANAGSRKLHQPI
jgi:hypothetical protein